jgi:hypothetical protein
MMYSLHPTAISWVLHISIMADSQPLLMYVVSESCMLFRTTFEMYVHKYWCNLNGFMCYVCYWSLMQVDAFILMCMHVQWMMAEYAWDWWAYYEWSMLVSVQEIVGESYFL